MKKILGALIPALIITGLAGWLGRSYIRNLFLVKMTFQATRLTGVDDNKPVTINDFKGKALIVSCYQTWCPDCAKETLVLDKLAGKFPPGQFKVLYISNEGNEKVSAFRNRFPSNKIDYLRYENDLTELGIKAFPTTFLINENGQTIKTKSEGYDWLKEEASIRKMLTE